MGGVADFTGCRRWELWMQLFRLEKLILSGAGENTVFLKTA
jgi:hypothetical protein